MVIGTQGPNTVISPCISICELNADDVCLGCGRSLDEIAEWSAASDEQRQHILLAAEQRRSELQLEQEETGFS